MREGHRARAPDDTPPTIDGSCGIVGRRRQSVLRETAPADEYGWDGADLVAPRRSTNGHT